MHRPAVETHFLNLAMGVVPDYVDEFDLSAAEPPADNQDMGIADLPFAATLPAFVFLNKKLKQGCDVVAANEERGVGDRRIDENVVGERVDHYAGVACFHPHAHRMAPVISPLLRGGLSYSHPFIWSWGVLSDSRPSASGWVGVA